MDLIREMASYPAAVSVLYVRFFQLLEPYKIYSEPSEENGSIYCCTKYMYAWLTLCSMCMTKPDCCTLSVVILKSS